MDEIHNRPQSGAEQAGAVPETPGLKRAVSLPMLVLYGLGVTIGAGIYVLVGVAAGRAGSFAPVAFLVAAIVMGFSGASFAELSRRYPVSAGEAAYVRKGLRSHWLALVVGLLVAGSGAVSSAAITVGSAGYLLDITGTSTQVSVPLIVICMGAIASWGIKESVMFAAVFTLVEIAGLLIIVGAGFWHDPAMPVRLIEVVPLTVDPGIWSGILGASLLAFFAFMGFEDMVNLAEEVRDPEKTIPRAIFLTLVVTTLIYVLVISVAVLQVPPAELAGSPAPLSLVFETVTGRSGSAIGWIAIFATLNGVIIQMIMASRVIYGLAEQNSLPSAFQYISPVTRTPIVATGLVVAIILVLAMTFPIDALAEWTSRIVLTVFLLVNLSLAALKIRGELSPDAGFSVPVFVPVAGAASCVFLLTAGLFF